MKGQFFSSDFILSAVIFVTILLLLLPLWNDVNLQIADAEAKRNLQIAASSISDLLVKSPGSPFNWTPDNVSSTGLADTRRVINLTKFEFLREIGYSEAKASLGINQYNFSINITDEYGLLATSGVARSPVAYFSAEKEDLKSFISDSGLTWDYYWGHDLPSPEPGHPDARFFYAGSKTDMLNALLFNASVRNSYRTIIVEEPDLDISEFNTTALSKFLLAGGRFILEGKGYAGHLVVESFGANTSAGPNTDGLVIGPDWFVRAPNSSSVSFQNSEWAVNEYIDGAKLNIEIADPLNQSRGLVASWDYGPGRIYYITDANASIPDMQIRKALNIAGERLEYGSYLRNATNAIISNRLVTIEGDSEDGKRMGRMRLVMWE